MDDALQPELPDPLAPPVIYRIDAANRICYVSDSWDQFARANQGLDLISTRVLGRPLWTLIRDRTVGGVYEPIIRRVRAGHGVRFRYRCDAPFVEREMLMDIRLHSGLVEFTSTTRAVHSRSLPDSFGTPGPLVRVCSWCGAVARGTAPWRQMEDGIPEYRVLDGNEVPQTTHGMCSACADRLRAIGYG